MGIVDMASLLLTGIGTLFFVASTLGLIRFPDVYSRLHALTKADNIGLGFILLGLALRSEEIGEVAKLLLIWLLTIVSSCSACYLIAQTARRMGIKPWRRP